MMPGEQGGSRMPETLYDAGKRQVWTQLLWLAATNLDLDIDKRTLVRLAKERDEAVTALRRICATHGGLDWPADLHLADILEKHLERYLP